MKEYYQNNWSKVVENLGTNIYKGLLEYDCILRRQQYGDNKINMPSNKGIKYIFKDKINWLNMILYIGIFIYFIISKNNIFMLIWLSAILSNLIYSIYLGIKEKKDIDALGNLNSVQATVLREGIERIVKAEELVKGDIVLFKNNSFISADLRIISSDNLKVDERNITGDKLLKDKYETMLDYEATDIGAINNMLFKGSIVKEGSGSGIVVATGSNTQLGLLLSSLEKRNLKKTNIMKKIDSIVGKIHIIFILLALLMFMITPGKNKSKMDLLINSVFISTTIFSWIAVAIYSKKITKYLLNEGIELSNLSILNDCKLIKVLFMEKYGTVTQEKLIVRKAYFDEKLVNIDHIDLSKMDAERLINIATINTDIYAEVKDTSNDIFGEAYANYLKENQININELISENKFVFRANIDSSKGLITTVTKNQRGYRANSRGHIESILQRCTSVLINGVEHPLTAEEIDKIKLADLCIAREGLISEAMAYRTFSYEPTQEENVESNMVFAGLVGLENPIIDGVVEDIESLYDEGILPLLFCEENKIVSDILGRKIGLISSSKEVISGLELSFMSEKEFYKTVSKTRVFCRLSPDQKKRIIEAFDKDGFAVAVEGETLSDLSNVAIAKIGITKGKAPKLLKKVGEFHTEGSAIKSLLNLRKKADIVKKNFEVTSFVYVQLVLAQLLTMFNYYFVDNGYLFSNYTLILLNTIFSMLVILLALGSKESISKEELLGNMVMYAVTCMCSFLPIEQNAEILVFLVLTINMFITVLRYVKFSRENLKRNIILSLLIILTIVLGTFIIIYTSKIKLTVNIISIILLQNLVYFILIVLMRKWQD